MKKLLYFVTLLMSITFWACESSTSAEEQLTPISSDSSNLTSSDSQKVSEDVKSALSEEQIEMLNKLLEYFENISGNGVENDNPNVGQGTSLPGVKLCTEGDTQTGQVGGVQVTFTCINEQWVITGGLDKLLEKMDDAQLNQVLENLGLTKEELLEVAEYMSTVDFSKNEIGVTCEGELDSDAWYISVNGVLMGQDLYATNSVTFENGNMKSISTIEMNVQSEALCNMMLNDDDDEDLDDEEIYGKVVEEKTSCEGAIYKIDQVQVKENITENERKIAYDDLVGQCKDYRDGKITFEELMEE